jgi:hypothetical protein
MTLNASVPVPGLYRTRAARKGRWMPVLIEDISDRDPATGELMEDQRFRVLIDGREAPIDRAWPWAARNPVTQAEYDELMAASMRGHNNPPAEDVLTEAAVLCAEAVFVTRPGALVDAIKKATGLIAKLEAERKAKTDPLKATVKEIEAPYKEQEGALEEAKAQLTDALERLWQGENIAGTTATAFMQTRRMLVVMKPQDIPREYLIPDTKKIEAALKKGQAVPGAELRESRQIVVT